MLARGIMNVDLNNPLAVKYMEVALRSWERVSDIFEVEVVQCITPDTLLEGVNNNLERRSPQELAALHTHYRSAKRMASGERFWNMEHDAYLKPEGEEFFRMILSKWKGKKSSMQLGMANEFWTTIPEIAQMYCERIEKNYDRGPMQLLHTVTDVWRRKHGDDHLCTYWPANRFKNKDWTNKTGLNHDVSSAYNSPVKMWDSPVTQILDEKYGSTVTDREKQKKKDNQFYTMKEHPDALWITLD
jgi:hypothetical protein